MQGLRLLLSGAVLAASLFLPAASPGQTATPANDDLANAEPLSPGGGSSTGDTSGATKEAGEPEHAGNSGGASVWYALTLPVGGDVTIDTCGPETQFDTLLAVYAGSSYPLTPIAANDDEPDCGPAGTGSRVSFTASRGTTFRIAVDGYGGASGPFSLAVAVPPGGEQPAPPAPVLPGEPQPPAGGVSQPLAIRTGGSVTSTRGGKVRVPLANPNATPIEGTLTLTGAAPQGARSLRLGSRPFSLGGGQTRIVAIRLSRAHLRLLARARKLQVTATLAAGGSQGGEPTARRTFTVRAPRALKRPPR